MKRDRTIRWSVLMRSQNRIDGKREFILWHQCQPLLFRTRELARVWIEDNYAYIRTAADLKAEPHGWKMPKAVRVAVTIKPI